MAREGWRGSTPRTWCSWTRRGRTPPCSGRTATPPRASGWSRRRRLAGWQTVTFVGALTAGGLAAPWALEGAMNGEWFLAYVEQVLVPALRPGMVVVMDNLPGHKVAGVEEAIAAAGCRLEYLPAYSPDLNPIENAYSKLKRALRDWAARTVEGVYEGLRRIITRFSPASASTTSVTAATHTLQRLELRSNKPDSPRMILYRIDKHWKATK